MKTKSILMMALAAIAVPSLAAVDTVEVVQQLGDVTSGSGGLVVTALNPPTSRPNGDVAFTGGIGTGTTSSDRMVWTVNGIAVLMSTFGYGTPESTMGFANNGDYFYSPSVGGNDAVVSALQGVVLQATDPAPGLPGLFSSFNSRPSMSASGTAFWVGGTTATSGGSTSDRVLWRKDPGQSPTAIYRGGSVVDIDSATVNANGVNFAYSVSDDASKTIAVLQVTSPAAGSLQGIYLNNGVRIARQNDAFAPISGTYATGFSTPGINDAGQYIFAARATSGVTGTIDIVQTNLDSVIENDIVDQVSLDTSCRQTAINSNGFIAMLWGSTSNSCLYVGKPGLLPAARLIARTGDDIDLDGDYVPDAVLQTIEGSSTIGPGMTITSNNDVVVRAKYLLNNQTVASEGIVKFKLAKLADIDKDGEVGPSDFSLLASLFGTSPSDANWDADADIDWDGEVGPGDFSILAANFGN